MTEYVIRRTDQGGGYLAPPGSLKCWIKDARKAQRFPTRKEALTQCCENEIPEAL